MVNSSLFLTAGVAKEGGSGLVVPHVTRWVSVGTPSRHGVRCKQANTKQRGGGGEGKEDRVKEGCVRRSRERERVVKGRKKQLSAKYAPP